MVLTRCGDHGLKELRDLRKTRPNTGDRKMDNATCRDCHGSNNQIRIGFGDFCDTHVPQTVFFPLVDTKDECLGSFSCSSAETLGRRSTSNASLCR